MEVKSRHHLRSDEVRDVEQRLADRLGVDLDADTYELVELDDSEFDVVLVDGDPAVLYYESEANASEESSSAEQSSADSRAAEPRDDGDEPRDREPFLTVRGANDYPPRTRVVTVDAGAVSFVSDGADVMRPGITEADDDIEAGDLVAIAEESHGKVLAVGRAKTDGDDMVGDEGKVVESVHHVGDELYEFAV